MTQSETIMHATKLYETTVTLCNRILLASGDEVNANTRLTESEMTFLRGFEDLAQAEMQLLDQTRDLELSKELLDIRSERYEQYRKASVLCFDLRSDLTLDLRKTKLRELIEVLIASLDAESKEELAWSSFIAKAPEKNAQLWRQARLKAPDQGLGEDDCRTLVSQRIAWGSVTEDASHMEQLTTAAGITSHELSSFEEDVKAMVSTLNDMFKAKKLEWETAVAEDFSEGCAVQ
jgi:hypothetical protein